MGLIAGERAEGPQGGHSECPSLRRAALPPRPSPLPAHHAQVVHEAGPVGPNVGRRTGQWLHADLLAAVQLPDGTHHHVHGVKHQGCRQLGGGRGGGRMAERQLSQAPHSLRQGPSLQECGTRQAGSEDGSRGSGGGAFPRESDGYGEKARAARVSGGVMQPLSPSHAATRLFGGRGSQRGLARMASQVTSTGRCPRA